MAVSALSADADIARKDGDVIEYPMAAPDSGTTTIYKGSGVVIDDSGYAVPAEDSSGYKSVGIAVEQESITSDDSDGDEKIKVYATGRFKLPFYGGDAAITDVDSLVFWKNSASVELTDGVTNHVTAGKIDGWEDADNVWVNVADKSTTATS